MEELFKNLIVGVGIGGILLPVVGYVAQRFFNRIDKMDENIAFLREQMFSEKEIDTKIDYKILQHKNSCLTGQCEMMKTKTSSAFIANPNQE